VAKRIAGKIFSTPEEAGVTRPTAEELAEARKLFDEAQQRVDNLTEADYWTEIPKRFRDDLSGTEYEGWRSNPRHQYGQDDHQDD
jgi:hypothetical protein